MRTAVLILTTIVCSVMTATASAQITFFETASTINDDRVAFQRLGVNRGGVQFIYRSDQVILPTLDRINGQSITILTTPDGPIQDGDAFLRDLYLNTGLESPGVGDGSRFDPGDQWTKVTFDKPIVNSDGPDGFVASFQFLYVTTRYSPLILSTSAGHSLVMPTSGGIIGTETALSAQYVYFPAARTPEQLLATIPQHSGWMVRPSWVAQTFDLTEMGVALGQAVSSLYIQDWSGAGNPVYPTFIAGFAPVPEPATWSLLATGLVLLAGMSWRHRAKRASSAG